MWSAQFKEANSTLRKPAGMSEEECGDLPVWTDGKLCVSLWRPSLRERLSVLLFGRVWLFVLGYTQPPVTLEGKRTVFEKAKEAA